MDHLFDGIEKIFASKYSSQHSSEYVIISQIIISLILFSQHIQLFWYPTMLISDWSKYQSFWNAASLFSLDIVAIELNFVYELIICVICLISATSICFIFILVLTYFKYKISAIVINTIRIIITLICEVFFITCNNILLAITKYSLLKYAIVEEYSLNNQTVFDIGIAGGCAGIILLILINLLAIVFNAGSCEIRQTFDDTITEAKSSVRINQISTIVYFINSFMYFTVGYNYYQPYLLILLLLYGYIAASYMQTLPFYSYYLNLIQIFFHLDCVLVILVFLIGSQLNNASIPFLIALAMQIALLVWTDLLLKYRISKISKNPDLFFIKFEQYELSIRSFLKSGELKENLLVKLNENFKYDKNSLNRVVSAYYCNDVLQNYKLAFNQIVGVKYDGANIILNYQIYKCRKIMMNICKKLSESHRIHQFFIDFEKVKLEDYHFCEIYLKFSEEIISPLPKLSRLKGIINKLAKKKKSLIDLYTSILSKFPNSEEVNYLYGSLLLDILYDIDKGQWYLSKIIKVKKTKSVIQNLDSLNDQPMFIFSGNPQTIGKILHANTNFLTFISFSMDEMQTCSFFNFLPNFSSKEHKNILLNFLENCTETVVYSLLPLFLLNYQGFLCECFISIECVGNNESVNFLCKVDPIRSANREVAVIDNDGIISAHSENFLKIFGVNQNHGENMSIQYFIPDIKVSKLKLDMIYEFNLENNSPQQEDKTIKVILKCCTFHKITIRALFLTQDIDQIDTWNKPEEFYINELNKYNIEESNENMLEEEKNMKRKRTPKRSITEKAKTKIKKNSRGGFANLDIEKLNKKNGIQNSEARSNSTMFLDKSELTAVKKSIRALKISKLLLFVSVTYN